MSWAVMLSTVKEVTEESVAAAQRKADRACQKKKDEEGKKIEGHKQDTIDVDGGVLALDPQSLAEASYTKELLEEQFQRTLHDYKLCLTQVFRDAKAFGLNNERRPQATVDRYLSSPGKVKSPVHGRHALFAQNLWPQLKNRGWKAEQVFAGGEFLSHYSFGGETVRYHYEFSSCSEMCLTFLCCSTSLLNQLWPHYQVFILS
jgi:hypothetical protein